MIFYEKKLNYLFFGFLILLFVLYIISQFIVGSKDTIYEYNVVIDDIKYNFSDIELPENSLPYIQFECIKMCIENSGRIMENYCMEDICLQLGK